MVFANICVVLGAGLRLFPSIKIQVPHLFSVFAFSLRMLTMFDKWFRLNPAFRASINSKKKKMRTENKSRPAHRKMIVLAPDPIFIRVPPVTNSVDCREKESETENPKKDTVIMCVGDLTLIKSSISGSWKFPSPGQFYHRNLRGKIGSSDTNICVLCNHV